MPAAPNSPITNSVLTGLWTDIATLYGVSTSPVSYQVFSANFDTCSSADTAEPYPIKSYCSWIPTTDVRIQTVLVIAGSASITGTCKILISTASQGELAEIEATITAGSTVRTLSTGPWSKLVTVGSGDKVTIRFSYSSSASPLELCRAQILYESHWSDK